MNEEDTTLMLNIFPISPLTNCALPASVYLDKSMNAHVAVPVCTSNITFGCITAMYPSQNTGAAFVDKNALALAKSVAVNKSAAEIVALVVAEPAQITFVQAANTHWITSSIILAMFAQITLAALATIGTGETSSRISEMIAYIPY